MPCITLLSDFGTQDASAAIAKGILLQHNAGLPLMDISHDVSPFCLPQAAYLLASAYKWFPARSFHIVMVGQLTGIGSKLTLSYYNEHFFLAPDNGIIPLALGEIPTMAWICKTFSKTDTFNDWLFETAKTTSLLLNNNPEDLGLSQINLKDPNPAFRPVLRGNLIKCEVIHIDPFENVTLNITRELFEKTGQGGPFRLQFKQVEEINELSYDYSDVKEGYKLCRFNNNGFLEISINRGKAASLFGLRLDGKNNDIKIIFE